MPRKALTAKNVKTLPALSTQTDYFDTGANCPGFGLRVTAGGRRTWFLMYRAGSQQKRFTIGTNPPMGLADAREAARTQLLSVQTQDANPAAAKRARRTALTFGALADLYLTQHARAKKRSWREDGRQLRSMVLPAWKNRPAADIERADVAALIDTVATTRGGITGNRLHALLSKLFRWAIGQGRLPANPMAGLPRPAAENSSRERALTDDEIRAFWSRLDEAEREGVIVPAVALWLRLRLLTAQRGGSIAKMRWADVDLDEGRIWSIPATDMKGKRPHVVPLSTSVVQLLKDRRKTADPSSTFVLQGGRGRRQRMGVTAAFSLEDFRPHDLRRTAATRMGKAGISRFTVARVLGHADRTVTNIYDRHEYLDEKRLALDTWARILTSILEGKRPDVVPFGRRA